jgi:hypothetical protein
MGSLPIAIIATRDARPCCQPLDFATFLWGRLANLRADWQSASGYLV